MATMLAPPFVMDTRSSTPPPQLTLNTSQSGAPTPIPNKHLPVCSPGPAPVVGLETPPSSPPTAELPLTTSLLYPPDSYGKLSAEPSVYSITAEQAAAALRHISTQPLPEAKQIFPWMHGLHPDNQVQLSFFSARRKLSRRTPKCLRGITVVKAGQDLSASRLKGAIVVEELLSSDCDVAHDAMFLDVDPREGFGVRNFHIQACKHATVSDIIVYGDDQTSREDVLKTGKALSRAQKAWKDKMDPTGADLMAYNTFVVSDPFSRFEQDHEDVVAVDSHGYMTGHVMDFFHWERLEMFSMSRASEISHNVWLGPTPNTELDPHLEKDEDDPLYDVSIECSDVARMPATELLEQARQGSKGPPGEIVPQISFPSSGSIMPPTWPASEVDGLMETVRWMYRLANSDKAVSYQHKRKGEDGLVNCQSKPRKFLVHCNDGYTETSLLAIAYLMYAEGLPVHEAWLRMHREKGRNFFAYPSDVNVLMQMQSRILSESPAFRHSVVGLISPQWLPRMDGSLPSRIMPYLYLGNLVHANNPGLLKELGILQVLSVGEPIHWPRETLEEWGGEHLLYVDKVQDNGVDALMHEFDRCLEFIEKGRRNGTATLVHCRVGVSRSATICIAEVMKELSLSFPRAYCFVRARRLNVIIQPHLRFSYELLKWEEHLQQRRKEPIRRELEWATIAREIGLMNKPYSKQ